jgi:hypothetical protein
VDGSSEEFDVRVVWYHGQGVTIGPNPFSDRLTLKYPDSWSGSSIVVLDNSGRIVHESALTNEGKVDIGESLAPGHYTLQVTVRDSSEEFRIFKY